MFDKSNYNLWSMCENYLSPFNDHYSITSINREDPIVYKTKCDKNLVSKIVHFASYFSFVLPLAAFLISRASRKIFSFNVQEVKHQVKVAHRDCDVIASQDGKETQEWRKQLIALAEHNIVISGNYCGGQAPDFNTIFLK